MLDALRFIAVLGVAVAVVILCALFGVTAIVIICAACCVLGALMIAVETCTAIAGFIRSFRRPPDRRATTTASAAGRANMESRIRETPTDTSMASQGPMQRAVTVGPSAASHPVDVVA